MDLARAEPLLMSHTRAVLTVFTVATACWTEGWSMVFDREVMPDSREEQPARADAARQAAPMRAKLRMLDFL